MMLQQSTGGVDWTAIIQQIIPQIVTGILLGLGLWFVKSLIGQSLSKEIERYKSELQLETFEHQTRFAELHARRAEIISKAFGLLCEAHRAVSDWMKWAEWSGEPSFEEKTDSATQAYKEFSEFYRNNSLFFGIEARGLVEKGLKDLLCNMHQFNRHKKHPTDVGDTQLQVLDNISRIFEAMSQQITREFDDIYYGKQSESTSSEVRKPAHP